MPHETPAVRDEYTVIADRLRDRYYQDFTAELHRRMTRLMQGGASPHEAASRARAELDELRRQMAGALADALLSAEAEMAQARGR